MSTEGKNEWERSSPRHLVLHVVVQGVYLKSLKAMKTKFNSYIPTFLISGFIEIIHILYSSAI